MGIWGRAHSTGDEVFLSDLKIRALKLVFIKNQYFNFQKKPSKFRLRIFFFEKKKGQVDFFGGKKRAKRLLKKGG